MYVLPQNTGKIGKSSTGHRTRKPQGDILMRVRGEEGQEMWSWKTKPGLLHRHDSFLMVLMVGWI